MILTLERNSSGRQSEDLRMQGEGIKRLKKKISLIHSYVINVLLYDTIILVFTVSSLDAPFLPPVAHETRRHQGEDNGHEQEAHSTNHTSQ